VTTVAQRRRLERLAAELASLEPVRLVVADGVAHVVVSRAYPALAVPVEAVSEGLPPSEPDRPL